MTPDDGTTHAAVGHVYVCGACGKRSRTRYGWDATGTTVADQGWDSSCATHAVLCYDDGSKPWRAVPEATP